jgi:glycosyltransferase involved in cell wall biosynthesis
MIKKRKILGLYLGVTPDAGGMFQYSQCILDALISMQGCSIDLVVAYGDPSWGELLQRKSIAGVRLKHWRFGEKLAKLFMLLPVNLAKKLSTVFNPLITEISSLDCDVWIFPAQDVLAWQIDKPIISVIHDLMHRYERKFPEVGSWWRFMLREIRFRNLTIVSTKILVDSEIGKNQVVECYSTPPERIFSLPYIAPSHFRELIERPDFDVMYKLPQKFFFYPAQYWEHKNHLRLVSALLLAHKVCPDIKLVLSGAFKRQYEKIKLHVQNLGLEDAVYFTGYIPDEDLPGFYSRSRGLVMPTFFGPTNIPPLEAMTLGCPVLISGIYGMREQCGDAALYFSPDSINDIKESMIRLWLDDVLCEQLGKNGQKKSATWGRAQFNERLKNIIQSMSVEMLTDADLD